MQLISLSKLAILGLAGLSVAHPGAHEPSAMSHAAKRSFLNNAKRSLDQCAGHLERRGINDRIQARREAAYEMYRKQHLAARDYNPSVNTSHHSTLQVTSQTSEEGLFSKNPTCILSPEGEIGPFWVRGELVRSNVRDGEAGIPIVLDGQFIDIETCEPIQDLYWDVWNCNTTGVYSGVQDSSNGNGDDDSNLDKTFLRGLQKTDAEGVAQFQTIFPGHYGGRATHVHVVAHLNATQLPNNTVTGGHVSHIGQLFFDQDLVYQVEATSPYNTNKVSITTNADDHVVQDETEDSASDPFFEYALFGDSVEDGLFAWITMGVNVSASYDTSYAATLTSAGGIKNSDSASPGGM
ncbi:Intradiol ring-cleavage dioxygenase [Aspergillus avenaceus]|uniref:Intradiol ring-cleavage dioxygenase n=1 Tax=Aspergillus avenaceus TaxID=36643 RepID=A0A5N6U3V3_ASPAV|nr:Intradiol ring-cleavage dioxygenase [Aspergillus avenaceus]